MDIKVVFVFSLVFYIQMDGFVSAVSLKRLSEKIDSIEFVLEKRLEMEISQRHTDYDNILSKLDIITTKIERLEEKSSISSINIEQKFDVNEDGDLYKADKIKYLITGIKAEKKLNSFLRREISSMGRALHDLNTRVTREVSREDTRMTETNYKLEELLNNLKSSIENGFSVILSSQKDTRRILRQELKLSTSQLEVAECKRYHNLSIAIKNGISKILTTGNESRAVLPNKIEQCLKNHVDVNNNTTETSNTHISSNIPVPSEKIHSKFESCKDALTKGHQTSGVYTVHDIKVYCDQTTEGGGWTVFQRRMDGSVDFYRDWVSYKQGFGNVTSEFWLGNDYISEMLSRGNYELRIDMQDFEGNHAYAKYHSFRIDPESNNYTLHIGKYSGTAGDSLKYHNGRPFSTKDVDSDTWSERSCAQQRIGAWWYGYCSHSNLNGLYHVPPGNVDSKNVVWYHWKNTHYYSLKFVEMKFRQTDDA